MPCESNYPVIFRMTDSSNRVLIRRTRSQNYKGRTHGSSSTRRLSSESPRICSTNADSLAAKLCMLEREPTKPQDRRAETSQGSVQDRRSRQSTHKSTESNDLRLSPKSILKNFTAASYRHIVLANDVGHVEETANPRTPKIERSLCTPVLHAARSEHQMDGQSTGKVKFRYRLRINSGPPDSKRVTFDDNVSFIQENNIRRRHSTPSLPAKFSVSQLTESDPCPR